MTRTPPPAAGPPSADRLRRVEAAVKEWTGQLVDLGGRNTLLYYRDLKQGTLDLSPGTSARDAAVSALLGSRSVRLSDLFEEEDIASAARRMRTIRSKAVENQEERGLETLFLAWGMATWTNQRTGATPAAPVLLRQAFAKPRGGAGEDFDISLTAEWDVNPTLLHLLKTEFGVDIDGDHLLDATDVEREPPDATPLFEEFAKRSADVQGFAIAPRVVIANFSYAKLAMVLDIESSIDALVESPLICAIAGDEQARDVLRQRHPDVSPSEPDRTPPVDEFLVLDADASQSYVINAVVGGGDLVVEGPPGTGKSQTIANLIATLSARGKRVLFVAEKRAAIDAVLDRLERVGLGDLVLDLHEGAAARKKVAAALARGLADTARTPLPDLAEVHDELVRRRDVLVKRTRALHRKREPWNLSVYELLSRLPAYAETVQSTVRMDERTLGSLGVEVFRRVRADLESFVGLGGLSLSPATSPWGAAFAAGSISSPEIVQEVQQTAADVRQRALPDANLRLDHLLAECGLARPATLGSWQALFELLDGVTSTLESFDPGVFELPLAHLDADLAPLQRGAAARAWASITNSGYRRARKAIAAVRRSGSPKGAALGVAVGAASDQDSRWRAASADGGAPRLPSDLLGVAGAYQQLSDELRAVGAMAATPGLESMSVSEVDDRLGRMLGDGSTLHKLPALSRLRASLLGAGLVHLLNDLRTRNPSPEQATAALEFVWLSSLLDNISTHHGSIGSFDGASHLRCVERFKAADVRHIATTAMRVRRAVAEAATRARDDYRTEADVVQHQARLKRGHMPIRHLFQAAPHVVGALKPCWAMSPLVVSQLLPNERCFDVVIFDEASQVTPADAVGALMRASQAVVAGDPHQLPPTNFFMTSTLTSGGGEDDEDAEDELLNNTALTKNLESVLDVMAALLPPPKGTRTLGWHYRSRDERLIAFSNAQPNLYDGALTTFPGVVGEECLHHELVPFQAGRVGQEESASDEVRAVVELVTEHAKTRPGESLGVIAMGIKHANRISEALRRRRQEDEEVDAFLDGDHDAHQERFFVKNLERVQGDERDAIILTIGYGKNPEGRMLYRFGPVNVVGGERRLNVAITRARSRMTVVSSFASAEMDQNKLNSDGAKMLCSYLAYAESGGENLGHLALSKPELNPFERDVRDQLNRAGIPLVAQLGCSGYWIDFAAQHPVDQGRYVLAIECDGATYHSCETARDRDRLRQEHLERLGWTFHRIWSQEWFYHREKEIERAGVAYKQAVDEADRFARSAAVASPRAKPEAAPAPPISPSTAPARKGPRPISVNRGPITEYDHDELVALVRWVESDTLLRTEEELITETRKTLGFQKNGARIVEAIQDAIHTVRSAGSAAGGAKGSQGTKRRGSSSDAIGRVTVRLACGHAVRVVADPAGVLGRFVVCRACGRQVIRQLV